MEIFQDDLTRLHLIERDSLKSEVEPVVTFEGLIENIRDIQEDLYVEGQTYVMVPLVNKSFKRAGDVIQRFFEKRKCCIDTRIEIIRDAGKNYKYLIIFINPN